MESTRVGRGFANSRVPKKEEIEYGMEQGEGHQSRVSSSRRTRSQLAPDWTINDSLILVNEIAAVEGECLNALSTYQKWKIIAENCTALDVSRTFNQCRRKWDSLLFEYNKIKKWESRSRNVSFWTLESERRRELGLPVDFERELFKAIDDLVSSQEVRSDTDPGTDPEAEDDRLEVIAEYGFPEPLRLGSSGKSFGKICGSFDQLAGAGSGPKKQKRREMPQKTTSLEEKEQMMVMKLRENADLIDAIVKGNLVDSVDFGLGVQRIERLSRQILKDVKATSLLPASETSLIPLTSFAI
ncbi:Trihelix transcription factor ASR3 [Vitis vinifera]|uniref:Trihelix transcription factor ASR3 n=1 Tax=Vitis vinifera TaxID=29760 RepID=A0A438C280_VITVI|nr:Trihelix transcription factor ASR3 [Vitis vinifera]